MPDNIVVNFPRVPIKVIARGVAHWGYGWMVSSIVAFTRTIQAFAKQVFDILSPVRRVLLLPKHVLEVEIFG